MNPQGKTSGEKPVNDKKQKHICSNLVLGTEGKVGIRINYRKCISQVDVQLAGSVNLKLTNEIKSQMYTFLFCFRSTSGRLSVAGDQALFR